MTVGVICIYARPFTNNYPVGELSEEIIPTEFKKLHGNIMRLRHTLPSANLLTIFSRGYGGGKWGKYLRATDLYFDIVDRFGGRLVTSATFPSKFCLCDLLSDVRTGYTRFAALTANLAASVCGREWPDRCPRSWQQHPGWSPVGGWCECALLPTPPD